MVNVEIDDYKKSVFEHSSLPIVIMDGITHRFVDCNPAAIRLYGFSAWEATIGKTPVDVSAPLQYDGSPSKEATLYFIDKALRDGSATFDWKHQRPDGTIWDAEVHLLRFSAGERQMLQFTLIDITERKNVERIQTIVRNLVMELNSCSDFRHGLESVLTAVLQSDCLDSGGIYLVDPQDASLTMAVHRGLSEEFVSLIAHLASDHPNSRLAFAGEPQYGRYSEIVKIDNMVHRNEGLRAFAMIPIHVEGKLVAHMNLASHTHDTVPGSIRTILETIAYQVGGSLTRLRAEDELKQSNDLLFRFIKRSPIYAYIKSVKPGESRVIYASDNFANMIDIPGNDIIGKSMAELFPEDFAAKITADDWNVVSGKNIMHITEELNGRHYITIKYPIPQEKRHLLAGYTIDITEQKHTEDALRCRELELRTLMNNLPGYIIRFDCNGKLVFINKTINGIMGKTLEKYQGSTIGGLGLPPQVAADIAAALQSVVAEKRTVTQVYAVPTSDGIRYFDTAVIPELDCNNEPHSIIMIAQDITERKLAEEALQRSEIQYKTLFMSVTEGIYLSDPLFDNTGKPYDYRYLDVNPKFEQILGLTRDKIVGKTYHQMVPVDTTQWLDNYFAVALTGEPRAYYFYSAEFDRHFETYAYKTTMGQIVVFVRDVTEPKRAEAELRNIQKLESLSLLAGGIAHDFNNLLGGIFGYIDLALQTMKDGKNVDYLTKALRVIDRARGLTRQLLTFAKGGDPVKQPERFTPFIEETVQFALSGSKCTCSFNIDKELWMGKFDRNQIGQVIDNIIINAQQAMPNGGQIEVGAENVRLSEKKMQKLAAGIYVKIAITDHGTGIPKEIQSRIFDPFFTTKQKGHGLGLATSYSIISRHGGAIEVASKPGKGTTFSIYIPAISEDNVVDNIIADVAHRGCGTILIMDDEEPLRVIIKDMLESLGYSVICTVNGIEALTVFRADRTNSRSIIAMMFDLTVPGGEGGREVIKAIREVDENVPVFVASGYADDPVIADPQRYGFTDSICKPFRSVELAALIGRYLSVEKTVDDPLQ